MISPIRELGLVSTDPNPKLGQIEKKRPQGSELAKVTHEGLEGLGTPRSQARDLYKKKIALNIVLSLCKLVFVGCVEYAYPILLLLLEPHLYIAKEKVQDNNEEEEGLDRNLNPGASTAIIKNKVMHKVEAELGWSVQILRESRRGSSSCLG